MGVDPVRLQKTIDTFNSACPDDSSPFEPAKLDGLGTKSSENLRYPKSNWALKIEQKPFVAYAVACGITFTYGGIATDVNARVLNNEGRPMPGLWRLER